jgi:hypothetical protein
VVKGHLIAALGAVGLLGAAPNVSLAGFDSSSTVFVIVLENRSWSGIKGNANAPYINNTLLPIASYAEQYYTPPGIHPSLPNYLWLEAGTNFGILNDNPPSSNHQSTTNHFVTFLRNSGVSWKTYQENITGTTCPTTDNYPYAVRHNPFAYFDDIVNNYCTTAMRPFTELPSDLINQTVAHYNFITPNLCDDMHDSCAPTNNPVKQGDTWLSQNLPMILHSAAYQSNGLVLVTWDEGTSSSDGPIGMIVLSPLAKGGGYHNSVHYTHSSTLRTLQKIFGVGPLLGGAATATDLSDLFLPDAIPTADSALFIRDITQTQTGITTIRWPSQIGTSYRVQWKNALFDSLWQSITPDFSGTGAVLSWTDNGSQTGGLAPQRFYRVTVP